MKDYKFTDEKFMTAKDKMLVLKDWERFLKNGLRAEHFTERIYNHLTLHCSFIAHYDRGGFYHHYFGVDKNATAKFLNMFDPNGDGLSVEYGAPWWLEGEFGDINDAMREVAGPYINGLLSTALADERAEDLANARRLLMKHNIETEGIIPEWK